MNAAIMESPSEWNKEEKKEKTQIMKRIVERHTEATDKTDVGGSGKENSVNSITSYTVRESAETKI